MWSPPLSWTRKRVVPVYRKTHEWVVTRARVRVRMRVVRMRVVVRMGRHDTVSFEVQDFQGSCLNVLWMWMWLWT